MKYKNLIKISAGIIGAVAFSVAPMMVLAAMSSAVITSVATDGYINVSERASFPMTGTVTATTSASTLTINISDGTHSATSTLALSGDATTFSTTTLSASTMTTSPLTVKVWVSDGYATSTVTSTSTVLDIVPPTISAANIFSNNASTTLAKSGNLITLYATSSEAVTTPLITFTSGGVAVAGAVTVTNPSALAYKATYTTATGDTNGAIGFNIGSFTDTAGNATAASSTATTDGSSIRFDKTAPSISSVAWHDIDSSLDISATDTVVVTFSEVMATSTVATSTLGLSAHTFSNSALSWDATDTILTITLGSGSTVEGGDTINPTSAVTDLAGNADASTATAITDDVIPSTPVASPATGTYTSAQSVTLTSTGSSNIYYTTDRTTPTCSSTLYSGAITISGGTYLQAVGCDASSNVSSVLTSIYSIGSGGGGGYSYVPPVTPPIYAPTMVIPLTLAPVTTPAPAPAPLSAKFSRDLFVGLSGDDVIALQSFLESNGYLVMPKGVAKGYFGALTKKAVIKFQKVVNLPLVGRVGPMTRGILNQGQ